MLSSTSMLNALRSISTRAELATILEIKHSDLTYLLYKLRPDQKYIKFSLPKKSGGVREILAPSDRLKILQKTLAKILNKCVEEIEKVNPKYQKSMHGFKYGKSILTNSNCHRNRRFVFNVDLTNFFSSITGSRVRGFFINDDRFRFHPVIATTIAHIACYEGFLPQGSPSSPVISNLIAGILDFHLVRMASKSNCYYTRYADDLTFSTNEKIFPSNIAVINGNKWMVGNGLGTIINKSGFTINSQKVRMQYKFSRQVVTGLVVNKRVNVNYQYRRNLRACVNSLVNNGFCFLDGMEIKAGSRKINKIKSSLNYIKSVNDFNSINYKKKQKLVNGNVVKTVDSFFVLYRKLWFFQFFIITNYRF